MSNRQSLHVPIKCKRKKLKKTKNGKTKKKTKNEIWNTPNWPMSNRQSLHIPKKCKKKKLLERKATIWFNKMCSTMNLTPRYINITVSGNNQQSIKAKRMATTYRIN
jgi:hypothetical protein